MAKEVKDEGILFGTHFGFRLKLENMLLHSSSCLREAIAHLSSAVGDGAPVETQAKP